ISGQSVASFSKGSFHAKPVFRMSGKLDLHRSTKWRHTAFAEQRATTHLRKVYSLGFSTKLDLGEPHKRHFWRGPDNDRWLYSLRLQINQGAGCFAACR